MADDAKVTVSQSSHEDDMPPPPPPLVPPKPLHYEGPAALTNLPLPPPKETFSAFYHQRQKNELKRLFKHIHPSLRPSLDHAVDDELEKAVKSESALSEDACQGEVQSMRWIFENWTLDNIGDPHATKKLLDDEELKGGDVRGTSSIFEHTDSSHHMSAERQASVIGDVRTSTWLFETQPLDSVGKSKTEDGELVEAVLKESLQAGDVRGTRLLFESRPLSDLGRCNSLEDHSFLKLRSELQEQKGDVQKTVKLFQADPSCVFRDNGGNIHEIKSICSEEINSSDVSTARWLFETQPLDLINKGSDEVKIIRGMSLEEGVKGEVDQKRWMFETQSFDAIQEVTGAGASEATVSDCKGETDVINKRKLFETKPLAALKEDSAEKSLKKEEIIGGDVKTSLWLFETQPMETLSDSYEVGHLMKINLSADEQEGGKSKTLWVERQGIQQNTSLKEQEAEKGDVKKFKHLFETIPLSKIAQSDENVKEEEKAMTAGIVMDNKAMFEPVPSYAIKDGFGNLHKVTTVSREELIKGKVQTYRWVFQTKPLDQFKERKGTVEVLKGITRQEDTVGEIKLTKWLFETQKTDGIHSKFTQTEQDTTAAGKPCTGDVKGCKWLFETQPMDILYNKLEKGNDKEATDNTEAKSITWLFEPEPSDNITDGEEYSLKLCNTVRDSVKSEPGRVKRPFETETSDGMTKDSLTEQNGKFVSQVNFQSGDVSRVKELFESQSLDEIGSEMKSSEQNQDEHIKKGSVHKFTWMFDNCPMNLINKDASDSGTDNISAAEVGDVRTKKFIFETSSLDKIQPLEQKLVSVEKPAGNTDVKSSTMMFESMPLYAIRDKEGQFHEVTTVKKEEVMSGDVRGARWMFETKPLDAIKAENEIYVIRAVTQEDVKKGDVKSACWKFETQPLDSFTSPDEPSVRVTEDLGTNISSSCNVQRSKQIFESEQANRKFVRMVSVTDVQQGDVRTSTWLFENQAIDSVKQDPQEQSRLKTVHREDNQKGDVKRCTWLFESQPLDKISEPEDTSKQSAEDEIPKADVKCTTWLFETTPLDKITSYNDAYSLLSLYQMAFVHSSGIIIEARGSQNVHMVKYLLERNEALQIQKEEVVEGNIRNILLQLLLKPTLKPHVTLLREVEKRKINTTVVELPVCLSTTLNLEKDQRIQNTVQMIDDLLVQDEHMSKGIIMQETAGGPAEMAVYSLICSQHLTGAESDHSLVATEQIEIVPGDVKEAKLSLCQQKDQVERTIWDVLPGDVKNTKKVFSSERSFTIDGCTTKEEIIPGDVLSAKQQLAVKQPILVEKEEIVAGDIKATMQSLERAKQQSMCVEREMVTPGTIYDMNLSVEGPETEGSQAKKEIIISGDVKAAKRSLEMAKQQSLHIEQEATVPGRIHDLDVSTREESSSAVVQSARSSSSRGHQSSTFPKVSDAAVSPGIVSYCTPESAAHLVGNEFNDETTDGQTDVIRGDVKAAIVSLQSAATEQKLLDKEDVIRGNVQLALQSLGKSNVNVSKGDYKAAMIYRNSGRSKTVHKPCVVVSVPPSDTKLSPSISVTCEGQSPTTKPVAKGNCPSSKAKPPPPLPQPLDQEPRGVKPLVAEGESKNRSSPEHEAACYIKDTRKNERKLCHLAPADDVPELRPAEEAVHESDLAVTSEGRDTGRLPQATWQNLGKKESLAMTKKAPLLSNRVKLINDTVRDYKPQQHESNPEHYRCNKAEVQRSETKDQMDNSSVKKQRTFEDKVVFRERKAKETEDERRQRLSVHKEEIMKGNVKAAMEIFDNLRKREELKGILSQVQEMEGENDVRCPKTLDEDVPTCTATPRRRTEERNVDAEAHDDDLESISSVETAYEDLEKASKEIMTLKEQTLAKLLDIEDAIKKALYSISNLKSEADIAGLSGLFDESLKSEQSLQPANHTRKRSFVSSANKSSEIQERTEGNLQTVSGSSPKPEAPGQTVSKPLIRQSSSQSSPSFISIHSAARKPAQQLKSPNSTFKPNTEAGSHSCIDANRDLGQESAAESSQNDNSPAQRKVSVLEVKTLPGGPAGVVGTKTVSETYEESDGFGNVFVSSVTSTFVTKHSDSKASALFKAVGSPARYEVVTSPSMQRLSRPFQEEVLNSAKQEGTVFVTFSQSKEKH